MLSKELLKQVKGNICFWCEQPMLAVPMDKENRLSKQERLRTKTMDHLIARSQGGGPFCVSACLQCNSLKGSMHPMTFRDLHRPNVDAALLELLIEHARRLRPVSKAIRTTRLAEYHKGVYIPGYLSMSIQLTKPRKAGTKRSAAGNCGWPENPY